LHQGGNDEHQRAENAHCRVHPHPLSPRSRQSSPHIDAGIASVRRSERQAALPPHRSFSKRFHARYQRPPLLARSAIAYDKGMQMTGGDRTC
jgi:hypothetical protein